MRVRHPHIGLQALCRQFGKTRGAWYEDRKREEARQNRDQLVLDMVEILRRDMKGLGTEKLYHLLKPAFEREGIKMGRDKLHEVLAFHGLTINRRRRRPQTTWSKHWMKKWPNLVRDIVPESANRIWVSDITYIRIGKDDFAYLSLITDAYSRKVVGWAVSANLKTADGPLKALQMALEGLGEVATNLIHHSDRGSQYCGDEYVSVLQQREIGISMTEKKDPYENATAERMNGMLKYEFSLGQDFIDVHAVVQAAQRDIAVYNGKYPHRSIDMLTPDEAHERTGKLKNRWKREKQPHAPVAPNEGLRQPSNSPAGLIYSG
ncbi:MAG TPA: IS3 family transposase [Bacteroidetes bacterium]|nr:IS3 family transposase [Bacteroidota bacterium]